MVVRRSHLGGQQNREFFLLNEITVTVKDLITLRFNVCPHIIEHCCFVLSLFFRFSLLASQNFFILLSLGFVRIPIIFTIRITDISGIPYFKYTVNRIVTADFREPISRDFRGELNEYHHTVLL